MAIVIETIQTTNYTAGTTVVITKPTGLAVGDLLLAVIGVIDESETSTPTTPAGWTDIYKISTSTFSLAGLGVYYKVATADDVSASDFTFASSRTPDAMCGVLYRISGAGGANTYEVDTETASGALTFTKALTPGVLSTLINIFQSSSGVSYSSYTLTGGTSVTFTERIDTNSGSNAMAVADGAYASLAEITQVGVTTSSGTPTTRNMLVALYTQANASATATLLQATPVFFAPTPGITASGTATLLEATPTFLAPVSTVTSQKWTNTDKSAVSSVTNQDKS